MGEANGPRRRPSLRFIASLFSVALVAFAAGVFVFSGRAAELSARFGASPRDFPAALAGLDAAVANAGGADIADLDRLFDAAEESALSSEELMSVLKRRRVVARRIPAYRARYVSASVRLAERFPHAEATAAIAAEALLSAGDTAGAAAYAERITETRFLPVKAAALIASGRLSDPRGLPYDADALFLAASAFLDDGDGSASLVADAAIARLLAGEGNAALALLRDRTDAAAAAVHSRLRAELEYDFGDPREAAALFSLRGEAAAILRRADAESLSKDLREARDSWKSVASSPSDAGAAAIALYDLAATSSAVASAAGSGEALAEERSYLERLLALDAGNAFGAIRLSRTYDDARGDAILQKAAAVRSDGLLDLERVRRSAVAEGPRKTVASLWLLMNARPDDRRIVQWAAYYMETFGTWKDLAVLLEAAERKGLDEPWIDFHRALRSAREGSLDAAETAFSRAANGWGDWRIAADLAVVAEARRSMRLALDRYEIAASLVPDRRSAAVLQIRIARCLAALGKESESRRILGYALELDPENRTARMELQRLEKGGAATTASKPR